jgi:hypothetical protein
VVDNEFKNGTTLEEVYFWRGHVAELDAIWNLRTFDLSTAQHLNVEPDSTILSATTTLVACYEITTAW